MICLHRWKVAGTETQESGFDLARIAGATSVRSTSPSFFKRDVIVAYRCEKCGAEKVRRI